MKPTIDGLARRLRRRTHAGVGNHVLVHCSHHKVGSVWWTNVLRGVAELYGLRFADLNHRANIPAADVYVYLHTRFFDRSDVVGRSFRGSHLIRDPRDVVVSGYFYHLWTEERWANVPREDLGGRTYREELNRLDPADGLLLELERAAAYEIREMARWDYRQPEFIELRYEDLIADEAVEFERVFRHYGFGDQAVNVALDIADRYSFRSVTGRGLGEQGSRSHLRSGRPGEWREHFEAQHIARCKELAGQTLVDLGYEVDLEWGTTDTRS